MGISTEIRAERAGDEEAIRRVHLDAFGGDFEARLVDLLRTRARAVTSLVAVEDGTLAGHIVFSPVTIDRRDTCRALGLAPIGVLRRFQRRGIGSRLIREGLNQCSGIGYELVVLVGAPAYYTRFGFQRAKQFGLDNEYGVDEAFMALELRAGALEGIRGIVRYAREFAEV